MASVLRNAQRMRIRYYMIGVTWLLLCAANNTATVSKAAPIVTLTTTPPAKFMPLRGYSTDPCYSAKDYDVGTFCAQWKAADAAKSAADANWWTVYFAGLGVALAGVTLVAAIAAAYFAKNAAYENKRSADAAHGANRPWLDVDIVLAGLSVNYDGKGYSLQIKLSPLNAGVSPAVDVREHVHCLLYDHIADNDGRDSMGLIERDRALQTATETVATKLSGERYSGPTVFPGRDQPLYVETFVPWDFKNGFPDDIAWLIVGLRYLFPEGSGETIKVFSIRSFGFPDHGGFECVGTKAFGSVEISPVVTPWPRFGYVK